MRVCQSEDMFEFHIRRRDLQSTLKVSLATLGKIRLNCLDIKEPEDCSLHILQMIIRASSSFCSVKLKHQMNTEAGRC